MVYTVGGVNYTRRKKIPVTGAGSGAQTDFQIKLAATWAAAMQADFDDVRFTKSDMQTLIDAWLETKVDSTSADIWAEFLTTPADGVVNTEAYMYFGNASVASDWDGSATFPEFFDDFADGNYNGWTIVSETGDTISASTYELVMTKGGTAGDFTAVQDSTSQLSTKYNWEFLVEYYSGKRINLMLNGDANLAQGAIYLAFDSNGIRYYYSGAYHTICAMSADTKYRCVVVPNVSANTFDIYVYLYSTGSEVSYSGAHTGLNFRNAATYINQYKINEYSANVDAGAFDNTFVRKYAANPPTAAFGTEEHQRRTPMMM